MSDFRNYKSVKNLYKLSENPVDLRDLNCSRIEHFKASNAGYKLLYGFEKINDEIYKYFQCPIYDNFTQYYYILWQSRF